MRQGHWAVVDPIGKDGQYLLGHASVQTTDVREHEARNESRGLREDKLASIRSYAKFLTESDDVV